MSIRSLPEGTIFFPREPIVELSGPLIDCQIIESIVLNIIGYSILEASLGTRIVSAASGKSVVDFGFRKAHAPLAAFRAVRRAAIDGFAGTSNVFAACLMGLTPLGTMSHAYIQAYDMEQKAFFAFADFYREKKRFAG